MAVGNAVLDVVLAPGFLDHVSADGPAPEAAARGADGPPSGGHRRGPRPGPDARACARMSPNTEFVDAARGEKLLTITAGDNVVRLLPPLIVSEAEIGEAVARLDAHLRGARGARCGRSPGAEPPNDRRQTRFPRPQRLHRRRASPRAQGERRPQGPPPQGRDRARTRPLAGKVLAMVFDKPSTRTRVSFDVGDARARRRDPHAHRPGDAARPRRDHRRHGAGAVALRRRDHDPHPRPRDDARARRARDGAGDQRPDQDARIRARSWPTS